MLLVLLAIALLWGWSSGGILSSNDGSHIALARALSRGETTIDRDLGLTLLVDRSRRDGHNYSDRPPGTAFAALPAVWAGSKLDPPLLRRSLTNQQVVVTPTGTNFSETYHERIPDAPPLLGLQGTSLASRVHAIVVGLMGLAFLAGAVRLLGFSLAACYFVVVALGLCTLFGPYSTVLFSHGTAATCVAAVAWGLCGLKPDSEVPDRLRLVVVGVAGSWAVSCDYLLVVAIVPWIALAVPWRCWWVVLLAALPAALATMAYHDAAFGSAFSIGYDFHSNFEFARARGRTFDGNPVAGLWILWGGGRGAGVAAMSPVLLPGALGLWIVRRRWFVAWLPWIAVLSMHHTPWGGGTEDHRYLVPMVPLLAFGLATLWSRCEESQQLSQARWALCGLALLSAILLWPHFLTWRG